MKKRYNFSNYGAYIGTALAYIARYVYIQSTYKTIPTVQFVILKTFGINAAWTAGVKYPVAYWFTILDLIILLVLMTAGFFIGGLVYTKVRK